MGHVQQLLHGGPDSCVEEWFSYFRSHKREVARSAWELLLKNRRREPKVFCLNSGSCGSKYLVHLLRRNGLDRCFHEKAPDLDRTGVQYYLTGEHECAIKGLLLLTRNQVYLETSNRLFSLVPVIKDLFPNSKFIHLHRNGVDSVRSSVNKTLWPDVMASSTRLRYSSHLVGAPTLSPFERSCHYWANINKRIYRDLRQIEEEDVMSLKFESLIQGDLDRLELFLGHTLSTRVIDPVNTKNDLKDESAEVLGDFEDWPEDWKRSFVKICGSVQRQLGYEVPAIKKNTTAE